jgi:hypothetical protein
MLLESMLLESMLLESMLFEGFLPITCVIVAHVNLLSLRPHGRM